MLVVTRKADQQIHIGRDIVVTVVRVKGGAVRIGIDAPPEVPIARGELVEGGGAEARAAAGAPAVPSTPASGRGSPPAEDDPPGDPPPSGLPILVSRAPRAERAAERLPQPRVGPAFSRRRIRPIIDRLAPPAR